MRATNRELKATMSPRKVYPPQDPAQLDRDGGHYTRHVRAMTEERLHGKSEIAEQLGWRDREIARLQVERAEVVRLLDCHPAYVVETIQQLLDERECAPKVLDPGSEEDG